MDGRKDYRVEMDSVGAKDVPENVYYGVQSMRAAENFQITGLNMHPEIINSLAYIKKAAAITNCEIGLLEKKTAEAIVQACDEILEGRAPSDAVVMSWRGSEGGIAAAKLGHDVIMTPNSHFYFDYYQSPDADAEPFGIGGCVTIDKVYSFDPMADLTPGQQAHILGVQANLWTEYIASDDHLEYMLLPRLAALSEVQWCQPGVKDWVRFRDGFRMDRIYSQMGYVFAKHIFGIKGSYAVDPQKGAVVMTLTTQGDVPIHYTLDGSEPTAASPRYTGPVEIGKSARFRATALREGGENASYSREFAFSKSTGRPAVLNTKPNDSYTFEGASLLVDGYHSRPVFTSGAWLG